MALTGTNGSWRGRFARGEANVGWSEGVRIAFIEKSVYFGFGEEVAVEVGAGLARFTV